MATKEETKRAIPLSLKLKIYGIILLVCVVGIICLYVYVDRYVSSSLYTVDSQSQVSALSYKKGFQDLITNISNNSATGIPSVDDAGIVKGNKIEITPGVGDFKNLPKNTSTKTYTYYNNFNWNYDAQQYVFAYSSLLHQNSTYYKGSGAVKLFDKYTWVALGTYWAHKFGLPSSTGATYRVYLDTGKSFDIICFDTKRTNDENSVNEPTGSYSIAHGYGSNSSIIEMDFLCLYKDFPVRAAANSRPEMNYASLMSVKEDPGHMSEGAKVNKPHGLGDYNVVPEYNGNVIAIEQITDPKVEDLFKQATEEVRSKGYKG